MIDEEKVEIRLIDIEKVIRSQKNKKIQKLPKFIINILAKVIRQKELNGIILNGNGDKNIKFLTKTKDYLNLNIEIINEQKIPLDGRNIFTGNHPLGGLDFLAVMLELSKKQDNLKVVANEVLMGVENVKEMLIPVGVFSKTENTSISKLTKEMQSENTQILTFPAGRVSRKINGIIKDGEWRRSFIRHAVEYKRDIVPVFVDSVNSKRFYRVAQFRKFFRIKANLELFLIPAEVMNKKNKTIRIYIGDTIPYTTFNDSKSHLEWANIVKEKVYLLKK